MQLKKKWIKRTAMLAIAGTSLFGINELLKNKTLYLTTKILSKLPFSVRFDTASGSLFFGREISIENIHISKENCFNLEIDKIETKSSLWGLLFAPRHFFKSIKIRGLSGEVTHLDDSFVKWVFGLKNIQVENSELRLGYPDNSFQLRVDAMNTSKYGISLSSLFSSIRFIGAIDGMPIEIDDVDGDQKSLTKSRKSFSDGDSIKSEGDKNKISKAVRINKTQMERLENIPEHIKYFLHHNFSNVLIRKPRRFVLETNTPTMLKAMVFLKVPFVFESFVDGASSFRVEGKLRPGRKYQMATRLEWEKFSFPRVVADNARMDQFCVFLQRLFESKPDFACDVEVNYRIRQNVWCDKEKEMLSFFRVVSAIFSVGMDEYFS